MNIKWDRFELLILLVSATIIATLGVAGAIFKDKVVLGMSIAVVFGLCALIPAWQIIQSDDWLIQRSRKSKEKKESEPSPAGDGLKAAPEK